MQKMFATQLTGLFTRVLDGENFQIEDGARLLAQALVGEGKIYIKGFLEMDGVVAEALNGEEPLINAERFSSLDEVTVADRVILFTRFSDDESAIHLAEKLLEKGIPFVAVSGNKKNDASRLIELADIHIDTRLQKPLLPGDDGNRVGFPSLISALYIYHCLKFLIDEMIEEYEL